MVELIKPSELEAAASVFADNSLVVDNAGVVRKATPVQIANAGAPVSSEAQALAGTDNATRMTPLRVKQVLDDVTAPSVQRAEAWAISPVNPDPTDPDSKSAKTWSGVSEEWAQSTGIPSGGSLGSKSAKTWAEEASVSAQEAKDAIPYIFDSIGSFFATSEKFDNGFYVSSKDGAYWLRNDAYDADFEHPVTGQGYDVGVNGEGEMRLEWFGAVGDGIKDNKDILLQAFASQAKKEIPLRLGQGVFLASLAGENSLTSRVFSVRGVGDNKTIIDGGGRSNAAVLSLTTSGVSVEVTGVKFQNIHRPLHAGGATFVVSSLSFEDVEFENCSNGFTCNSLIGNVYISKYRARNLKNTVSPTDGIYGLQIGGDRGENEPLGDYYISDFTAIGIDGTTASTSNPVNGIAIRGRRVYVNKFYIKDVLSNSSANNCEGFYAKMRYSMVQNGEVRNAGRNEGGFVLKGNLTETSGFPSYYNIVKNVHVFDDAGIITAGFRYLTDSVFTEQCTVNGAAGGFACVPLSEGQSFTYRDCVVDGSISPFGWSILGGNVSLENCKYINPKTDDNKARPIGLVRVLSGSTMDAKINISNCEMHIPSTYDGTGATNFVWLSNQAGIRADLIIDGVYLSDEHTTTTQRGVYFDGAGTLGNVNVSKARITGVPRANLIRAVGSESMVVNDLGVDGVLNFSAGTQTLNEGHSGCVITNTGSTNARSFVLPVGAIGMKIDFCATASFGINVSAASGDTIIGSGTIAAGSKATAICIAANTWMI